MLIYADYNYYVKEYLMGRKVAVNAADFPFYERKAENEINRQTFERIEKELPIIEPVKMCCCELAEYFYLQDQGKERSSGIKSEKVDDYSVTYDDISERQKKEKTEIYNILHSWLSKTGLLYRGR